VGDANEDDLGEYVGGEFAEGDDEESINCMV
jgi:hypothetical protein